MRQRPFAFMKVGNRWINFALVTDVEDHGDSITVFFTSEMARLVGQADPVPLDVARQLTITDPGEVKEIKSWLNLFDEN